MSEAKDPESVFVVLDPDKGTAESVHLEESDADGELFEGQRVTRYDRQDPELQAHLLKGAERYATYLRICRGNLDLLSESDAAWLAADEKLRGAP